MQEEGLQIVGNHIYAPQGFNTYLKKFWEQKLAKGELYREPTPPPTSSDDSDSTPPKRNQKKPAIAKKKTPTQRPNTTSESPVAIRTLSASAEFTGPPPDATPAEVDQWVALWFRYDPTRTTPEGIVQCLAPGHTTPPWVQTWVNNARQVATANNNPDTNTLREDQPVPPAAAAAHAAPPPNEIDDDEDKKMPVRARSQRPSRATPTATGAAATSNILPSLDDLFLPEEEKELMSDHIIPWLSYNDITLNDDGTFNSDSIIPPIVQQWLIRRGGRPAAAPPSVEASDAAPPRTPPTRKSQTQSTHGSGRTVS